MRDYWNTPKGFFSLLVTCRCLSVCCVIVYWGTNKSNDSGLLLSATLRQTVDNCNWQETSPRHWDWANQLNIWRRAANLYIYLRHLSAAARTLPFNMIIGHVHGHMRMADCETVPYSFLIGSRILALKVKLIYVHVTLSCRSHVCGLLIFSIS